MILYPRGHKFRCPQGEAGHVYEENNLCIKEKRMVDSSFSNHGPLLTTKLEEWRTDGSLPRGQGWDGDGLGLAFMKDTRGDSTVSILSPSMSISW